jgi:putative DNA primase/helicase
MPSRPPTRAGAPGTPPGTNETLAFALYYLEQGLHPIPANGKVPIGNWRKYQAKQPTEAEVMKWFKAPGSNIGLVLGRGLIAVDLDGEGAEQLLADAGVELPADAPRSRTGRGAHVILRVSEATGNRVEMLASEDRGEDGKPLAQVDIRGDGGFLVVPPSLHASGHVYTWECRIGKEIPAAPAELLELIRKTGSAAAKDAPGAKEPHWIAVALKGVRKGLRDVTCTRLAGYYVPKLPIDVVKPTLYAFADRCTPPFPYADVDKCIESVARADAARAAAPAAAGAAGVVSNSPFQILGYNQGGFFYLPRGAQQVVELRAEQHSKLNLLRLAPLAYWERTYQGKQGIQWDMAANALIRQCEARGVYDVSRVRGRGAWWDGDRAVLHLGDRLIADGASVPIFEAVTGRYVYEAAPPMPIDLDQPLAMAEANAVAEVCELISWERPISARLLAGWIAVAPICGAIDWRPHVWITGQAGSGKSWVIDKVVRRLLGDIGLAVQSETTEAGLRQTLGHDARPIVFDEIEGEDLRAQQRIQNVLALARQASSETGAVIIKGSPLGIAKTYRIRSCFAFSSIGVGLDAHADQTRVAVLTIRPDGAGERFKRLSALVADTLTDDYVRRFLARSIRMAPVIRANARVFAAAGAAVIGSQRLGDQVGALLAGCYSLYDDGLISAADAQKWVAGQDWSEQKDVTAASDEARCLQRVLERVVRVQDKYTTAERTVAELVLVAACKREDVVTIDAATSHLLRLGIRIERGGDLDCFVISSSHEAISRMLEGTPWVRNWGRLLRRLPGALATGPVRFAGVLARGVSIPLSQLERSGPVPAGDPLAFPPVEADEPAGAALADGALL